LARASQSASVYIANYFVTGLELRAENPKDMCFTRPSSAIDNLIVSVLNLGKYSHVNECADKLLRVLLSFGPLCDRSYSLCEFGVLNHLVSYIIYNR